MCDRNTALADMQTRLDEMSTMLVVMRTELTGLMNRHDTTEAIFVQVVLLALVASFVFAFYSFRKKDEGA